MRAKRNQPLRHQPPWVLGVELSPLALRMVLLEHRPRHKLVVRTCREFPVLQEVKADSAAYTRFLGQCIGECLDGVRGNVEIWTSQHPDQVRIHQLEVSSASASQLPAAVFWAIQREEAFEARDYLLDFEIETRTSPTGGKACKYAITAFLLEKKDLWSLEHLFLAAGFPLTGIVLPVRALGYLLDGNWVHAPEEALAFAHIGDLTARIAVYEGRQATVLRSIPVGMESLARAVAGDFGGRIDEAQALRLLQDSSAESIEREILESIEPGLDRMARQIERTVSYYQNSTRKYGAVDRVFASGGIAAFPSLMEKLSGSLSLRMEKVDPFAHPHIEVEETLRPKEGDPGRFATAFGLAMAPGRHGQNFLRPFGMRLRQAKARRISNWIFAAFLGVVLVCGAFYGWKLFQLRETRESYRQAVLRFEELDTATRPDRVFAALGELESLKQQLGQLATAEQAAALIGEISRITPPDISLSRMSAQLAPPAGGREDEAAGKILLEGLCRGDDVGAETRVRLFARSLEASPLFEEASVNMTSEQPDRERQLRFALEVTLPADQGRQALP